MKDPARRRLVLPIVVAIVAAVVVVAGIAGIGSYAATHWRGDTKEALVVMVSSTRSAEDNEAQVAQPLEHALAGVEGIQRLRTESRAGHVYTVLTFEKFDYGESQKRVRDAVAGAAKSFPQDVLAPTVSRVDLDPVPTFAVGEARTKDDFERTGGVGIATVCGAPSDRVHVVLDPARLSALGVEVSEVVSALTLQPGLPILADRAKVDVEALLKTRIGKNDVVLSDIAIIERRRSETDCALARGADLKNANEVVLRIIRQRGADDGAFRKAIAETAKQTGARILDPRTTLVVEYHPPPARNEALEQAAWLAEHTGPGTIGVVVDGRSLEVIRTIDPSDTNGARAAASMAKIDRPKGSAPSYAGILVAPKKRPERLVVTLRGPELDALASRADTLRPVVEGVKGIGPFVGPLPGARIPRLDATIDREAAARQGVRPDAIVETLRAATSGIETGGIVLHAGRSDRADDLSAYRELRVNRVPLDRLLRIEQRVGPEAIVRIDRERAVELTWEITRDVAAEVKKAIADPNVRVEIVP